MVTLSTRRIWGQILAGKTRVSPFSSSPSLAENTQKRETNPERAHNHQECPLGRKVDVELKKVGWRGGGVRKRGDTRGEERMEECKYH